jgi:uridine kinase
LLIEGKPFNKPIYDDRLKVRLERTEKVYPSNLIILEGHLILTSPALRELLDLKVFIETDDDVRLSRRVLKMSKKGTLTNLQDLLYKYEKKIKPAYEKWIEPSKKYADIIIPNYGFSIDKMDIDNLIIPIPAVELIIKQVENSRGGANSWKKQTAY